jgi:hypothetical protein
VAGDGCQALECSWLEELRMSDLPADKGSDRVFLTPEQALAMLPEGEYVHTFRGGGGMMLGADWKREQVERAIRETDHRELAGPMATAMGHGLVINSGGALFVATKREAV